MKDLQNWNLGTARLDELLTDLSTSSRSTLAELLSGYCRMKDEFAAVVAETDAASICQECGGQCCLNGKYRINLADVLVFIAEERAVSTDFSRKPLCPYGNHAGCSLEAGVRPADCVLFICDAIDRKLSPQSSKILALQEQQLRGCISQISLLIGEQSGTPLLLWAERLGSQLTLKV